MSEAPEAPVLESLKKVIDPVFNKPMMEVGTLTDVVVTAEQVSAKVWLSSPSESVKKQIQESLRSAVADAGLKSELKFELRLPMREVMGDDPLPGVGNVILVMSGKGGVGKSTVATNLSIALKKMGLRVGLLDADIYGPSIPTMMGITGHPHSEDGKSIVPLERFGVKLMSIGFLLKEPHQAIVWRGPMLHGALNQFLTDVDWGELDYLVVDLPPGTGDVALTMAQKLKVTGGVMVTTPQEVALQDVYKGVNMCKRLNIPLLGIVENMSFFEDSAGVRHELFGSGGGETVAKFAETKLIAQIPIETPVREWGDKGTPIVEADPNASAAQAFSNAAQEIIAAGARTSVERTGGKLAAGPRKRLRILR